MKHKSKIMAVVLAVLLIACMLPTAAFATETGSDPVAISEFDGGTVTINASNADDSFALYKVIDCTYTADTNEVKYDFTANAKAYNTQLATKAPSLADYQGWTNDSTELKNYLGGFAAYLKANSKTAEYTGTATAKVCTITKVAMGQYLVLGTGSATGAYVYQLMTATFKPDADMKVNSNVTLTSKAALPTIKKTVNDTQVAYGDTVTYTVTVAIPTYPAGATNTTFSVKDTLPAGLTFSATTSITAAASGASKTIELTPTVSGQAVTWNFEFSDISAYNTLTIVYTATVNKANTLVPVTTGATNNAELTYSNDPYGTGTHTINDTATIYTYGIDLTKVEKSTNTALAGVEFELYKDSAEGTKVGTYTTDSNGKITIDGLDVGTYVLKETKTLTGYVLPTSTTTIIITDADKNGKVDDTAADNGYYEITVENEKGEYQLPQTGGIGTWVFTISGVVLMAGSVAFLLIYRKRSAKNN